MIIRKRVFFLLAFEMRKRAAATPIHIRMQAAMLMAGDVRTVPAQRESR